MHTALERDAPATKVVPIRPQQGRVTAVARKEADFYLRPLAGTPRAAVKAYRRGAEVPPHWRGTHVGSGSLTGRGIDSHVPPGTMLVPTVFPYVSQ